MIKKDNSEWNIIHGILAGSKMWFSWLFSLADKYQVRLVLILIIAGQFAIITKLSGRIDKLELKNDLLERRNKNDLRWINEKAMNMNEDAQKMKDSLYLNRLKIDEVLSKIKK